jgi:hypothetical protein
VTRFPGSADGQETRRQQTALMVDGQKGRVVMEFKQTPTESGEDAIAAAVVCIWACKHAAARSLNSRFGAGRT